MSFLTRFLLFVSLTLVSQFSIAVDYYWKSGTGTNAIKALIGTSPSDLCQQIASYSSATIESTPMTSSTTATCNVRYGPSATGYFLMARYGDTCPSGSVYNPLTGRCQAPPPVCKVGDLFPSKGTVGPVITGDNGTKHVASEPQTMCQNQCEYADPTARPSGCYSISVDQGYCNFIIKSTGNNCTDDDYEIAVAGDRLNPADTPNVPDSSPDPICPPGWTSSNGTCFKNPPKFCDPSTGEICAPGTTDPNKPAPDPGTGGTEGTPGEGEGGRGDSSSGADKDLQDLEGSKPDAEACKPAADGTGCAGSTVKGEQCDKVIECTGDAVQCSILRQQKKMACAYVYEEARPFIEQQIGKDAYKLTDQTVQVSGLYTDGLNSPRWLSSGCPSPEVANIRGMTASFSYQPACDFATPLGWLFVALSSVFFAVYVGRGFGGD